LIIVVNFTTVNFTLLQSNMILTFQSKSTFTCEFPWMQPTIFNYVLHIVLRENLVWLINKRFNYTKFWFHNIHSIVYSDLQWHIVNLNFIYTQRLIKLKTVIMSCRKWILKNIHNLKCIYKFIGKLFCLKSF
jgi:hypothetical protein